MKRRRIIIVAVFVAVLAWALLFVRDKEAENTIVIGGFRVSVLGVASQGKPFTTEKKWHPSARKILPGRFKKWIPSPYSGSVVGANNRSVTVLIQVLPKPGSPAATLPWVGYRSESLAGDVFEVTDHVEYPSSRIASTDRVLIVALNSFPRREPAFNLKLLANDGTDVGVLRVPNPTPGPFPVWDPHPLPQTATNGTVVLTLKSLANLPNSRPRRLQDGPNLAVWLSPEYELKSSDPSWARAKVVSTTADDATGNSYAPLPISEQAWRIRALVRLSSSSSSIPVETKTFEFFINPADVKTNSPAK